jgi:hypothetical protein
VLALNQLGVAAEELRWVLGPRSSGTAQDTGHGDQTRSLRRPSPRRQHARGGAFFTMQTALPFLRDARPP